MRTFVLTFAVTTLAFQLETWAWTTQKDVDKITDHTSYQIYQHSMGPVWHGKRADLTITVFCDSGEKSLRIDHPWIVGTEQSPPMEVTVRFDKEEPFKVTGFAHGDGKSFNLEEDLTPPNSQDVKLSSDNLIEKMLSHKKLIAQYDDSNDETYTAEFSLAGFSAPYGKALKCIKLTTKKTTK